MTIQRAEGQCSRRRRLAGLPYRSHWRRVQLAMIHSDTMKTSSHCARTDRHQRLQHEARVEVDAIQRADAAR